MKSQIRFVMHPDDECALLGDLLSDTSVLLIDGPRWRSAQPETKRALSSIGAYCIVWSPEDLPQLEADFISTCGDWYCRSEHSTIQFLRSSVRNALLLEGRFAISTEGASAHAAEGVERRYKLLRRAIKKTYSNSVVRWFNTRLPVAPAAPSRSANPSTRDSSLWVGPAALSWLRADRGRRIKQFEDGPVEGSLAEPPNN